MSRRDRRYRGCITEPPAPDCCDPIPSCPTTQVLTCNPPACPSPIDVTLTNTECGQLFTVNGVSANIGKRSRQTQTVHGFGATGTVVAIRFDSDSGLWVKAITDSLDHAADFVAVVIGVSTFDLLETGFHIIPTHNFIPLDEHYAVSQSVAGNFTLTSGLADGIIQNALFPISSSCLYVNLAEPASSVDVIVVSEDVGNLITEGTDGGAFLDCDSIAECGGEGGDDWHILGNAGLVDGTNFLGTTDDVALDFRVNDVRIARFVPNATEGQIIFGDPANSIDSSSPGCIILGGGISADSFGNWNYITDGYFDSIVGGSVNFITGSNAGINPEFTVHAGYNTIGGGVTNFIQNDLLERCWGANTISGGYDNFILCSSGSFIGGGFSNGIDASGSFGLDLTTAYATEDVVCGGDTNTISYFNAFLENTHDGWFPGYNVILGGVANSIENGVGSSILGGGGLRLGIYSLGYQNMLTQPSTTVDLRAYSSLGYFGDIDIWIGNTDNTARKLKFFEPNTDLDYSSTNYSSLQSQAQAANIEYILPAAAGTVGQSLKIQGIAGDVVTLEWA